MTQSQPSVRAKRTRTAKTSAAKSESRQAEVPAAAASVPAEQRRAMIAEAAYLRAAGRGFSGGDPIADWLESEREVDALLMRNGD